MKTLQRLGFWRIFFAACVGMTMVSGPANASLMKVVYHNDSFSVTTTKGTGTALEYIPLISSLISVPEYSMWGYAGAYEIDRKYENPSAPKVLEFVSTYAAVTEENSTGLIVQTYGDPKIEDTARASSSFTGIPIGPEVSAAGIITTSALEGIQGTLGIDLEVTQEGEGFLSSYARAEVQDPFNFSGLASDQTVWVDASIDAGTHFQYINTFNNTEDLLSVFESKITQGTTEESLFTLNIGVGNSDTGSPDIVVDVSTNNLFALDDSRITKSIYDALEFDSDTNTFSVTKDVPLFTLPINVDIFGDILFDPFSLSLTKKADTRGPRSSRFDFDTRRYDYDGGGLAQVLANSPAQDPSPVPEPHSFALVLLGLLLCKTQAVRKRA